VSTKLVNSRQIQPLTNWADENEEKIEEYAVEDEDEVRKTILFFGGSLWKEQYDELLKTKAKHRSGAGKKRKSDGPPADKDKKKVRT